MVCPDGSVAGDGPARAARDDDAVLSAIALIALPSTIGRSLGAILTTFLPAVVSCAVLAVGLLAQADGLRRCPDARYATGGWSGSNDA